MKIAKADKEDISKTVEFLKHCENFWDSRNRFSLRSQEDEWPQWDDEDQDKKMLLKIQRDLVEEEGKDVDNRLVIYEFIKRKYYEVDCHWYRVVLAADVLIDNCCDPTESHLAFHPGIEQSHVDREQ